MLRLFRNSGNILKTQRVFSKSSKKTFIVQINGSSSNEASCEFVLQVLSMQADSIEVRLRYFEEGFLNGIPYDPSFETLAMPPETSH